MTKVLVFIDEASQSRKYAIASRITARLDREIELFRFVDIADINKKNRGRGLPILIVSSDEEFLSQVSKIAFILLIKDEQLFFDNSAEPHSFGTLYSFVRSSDPREDGPPLPERMATPAIPESVVPVNHPPSLGRAVLQNSIVRKATPGLFKKQPTETTRSCFECFGFRRSTKK